MHLPYLTSALSALKVRLNPVGFSLTFNCDTALIVGGSALSARTLNFGFECWDDKPGYFATQLGRLAFSLGTLTPNGNYLSKNRAQKAVKIGYSGQFTPTLCPCYSALTPTPVLKLQLAYFERFAEQGFQNNLLSRITFQIVCVSSRKVVATRTQSACAD